MITIYLFLFALLLKDYSMNRKDLSNLYQRSTDGLFHLSRDYLIVWKIIIENEHFMITIYLFLFPVILKDYSMNRKDLSNFYKRSWDNLFLLSRDSLVVRTTMMGNERFKINIYVFLFALGLKYYSMNIQHSSNLYKRSMVCSFSPVIT